MKTVSPQYQARINSEVTTLCRLFTLTLFNGTVVRYTDWDLSLWFAGHEYVPGQVSLSAVRNSISAGMGNVTVTLPMSDDGPFPEAQVRAGVLDKAEVVIQKIDYTFPAYGVEFVLGGRIGQITYTDSGRCEADIVPKSARMGSQIGEHFSQECRNDFGNERCRYPVEDTIEEFEIVGTPSDTMVFQTNILDKPDGYWNFGTVEFVTGLNAGHLCEVAVSNADGTITLPLGTPYPLMEGDTGLITKGCNFTLTMCNEVYQNTINYRGEPHVSIGDEKTLMVQNTEAEGPPVLGADPAGQPLTNTGTTSYASRS